MRKQKSGHIINISSLLGYTASVAGFGLYGSTKFAEERITEGLALEVKPLGIHVTSAPRGYFRTNFAFTESYQASKVILDVYKDTVGHIRGFIGQIDGNQPGDPVRLAQAIVKLAASENPPIHLPLGSDSVAAFRTKTEEAGKEVNEWESISNSTDYPKN